MIDYTMSNVDYHASDGISSSVIRDMVKAPAICYARHFDPERVRDTSPHLIFGSALHKLVLEPDDFDAEFAVAPVVDRRTKAGKAEWADFQEGLSGQDVLTQDDFDTIQKMRDAIYRHDAASTLLTNEGHAEFSGWWHDERSDLLLKYRPDYATSTYIVDVKTTVDATYEGFQRSVQRYNYHMAADHYLQGEAAVRGHTHSNFFFVCVEKTPPYAVAVYKLGEDWIDLGHRMNVAMRHQLAVCLRDDEWPGLNNDEATVMELPPWMKNK